MAPQQPSILWFRVSGFGIGFRASSVLFEAPGFLFEAPGFGFRVYGFGVRARKGLTVIGVRSEASSALSTLNFGIEVAGNEPQSRNSPTGSGAEDA